MRVKTSREDKNTSRKTEVKSGIVIEIISSEYKREEYRDKTYNELKRQIFWIKSSTNPNRNEVTKKNKKIIRDKNNELKFKIFSIQTSEDYERIRKNKIKKNFLDSSPHRQTAEKGEGVRVENVPHIYSAVNIPILPYVCAHKTTLISKVV